MKRVGLLLLVAAALGLVVGQGVASGRAGSSVSWTMHGSFTCNDPFCSTTTGSGTAHSDSSELGAMTWTNSGGPPNPPDEQPVCPRNLTGFAVGEDWVFTTQSGATLDLTVDTDSLCLVSKQVATETATFHITGGTGSLSGASGNGTFSIVDLTSPSNESGKFNATITLP